MLYYRQTLQPEPEPTPMTESTSMVGELGLQALVGTEWTALSEVEWTALKDTEPELTVLD